MLPRSRFAPRKMTSRPPERSSPMFWPSIPHPLRFLAPQYLRCYWTETATPGFHVTLLEYNILNFRRDIELPTPYNTVLSVTQEACSA